MTRSPTTRSIRAMSIAELAPLFSGPDKWPRAYGLLRSLAIYYGQPWRLPKLNRLYRPFLGPGDLAFDIGAHVGNRTRIWAGLGARVVAIEPQADLATWLRWQFKGRGEITVVETALAAEPGPASMHVDPTNPTVTTLSGAWIDQVTSGEGFEGVDWKPPIEVEATTLDRLIAIHGLPDFMKIDVEGFEAEVLKGLSQPVKALSLEFLPAALDVALEAIDRLETLGRYRYNVSFGEGMAFDLADWQSCRSDAGLVGATTGRSVVPAMSTRVSRAELAEAAAGRLGGKQHPWLRRALRTGIAGHRPFFWLSMLLEFAGRPEGSERGGAVDQLAGPPFAGSRRRRGQCELHRRHRPSRSCC